MDPRLLGYYNQELQHLREMGAEFAQQFPKIAARLGMEGMEVADPYVERLLEGAGFLAARVQLKLDAEFPRFTQRLLEIVYPGYLAPTPSMVVVQLQPQLTEANLARGFKVAHGASVRSVQLRGEGTACEFRTAHDVTLWPIELVSAEYFSFAPDLPLATLPARARVRGGVRLKLRSTAGLMFKDLALDRLALFLSGAEDVAFKLHELALGACVGAFVCPTVRPIPWIEHLRANAVRPLGYADDEALLPVTLQGFQGHRLLQEYFAFPHRYLFLEVTGLAGAVQRSASAELELVLLFGRAERQLEGRVDVGSFSLHCTPAINLFPKRADRMHISDATHEYHVVPDRTRPMDFEVYDVGEVTGFGVGADSEQHFLPLYTAFHSETPEHRAYFTARREPRLPSISQQRTGFRSSYVGSEVFVAIVDPEEAPFRSDLRLLAVNTLSTNRDLPLQMPVGAPNGDFTLESAAPLAAIRCVKGPSKPVSPHAEGKFAWRLISQLSLNYLSLLEPNERDGAAALRELLQLYARTGDSGTGRQIEGLRTVRARRLVRRLPLPGPIAFGRGLGIDLEVDELAFQGASAFLFGSVMERFLARHVSLNSFTETALSSSQRGEIMRWIPRCGERPIL